MKVFRLDLRAKLLIPVIASFVLLFSLYTIYVTLSQRALKNSEKSEWMENQAELIATANASYVWNIDYSGLAQSLASFMKDRSFVAIDIQDSRGNTLSKAEVEKRPNLIAKERPILYDGQEIGKAKVVFTDHFLRAELARTLREQIVFGLLITAMMILAVTLVANFISRPIMSMVAVAKDMAQGEGDLTTDIPV
jgi:methyl-accepting chemotaxis protein